MKLIEFNWNPKDRQLREFAVLCLFVLPAVAWFWGASPRSVAIAGAAGSCIAIVGLLRPATVRPLFLALTIMAMPVGMLMGELVVFTIFFLLFLPIALVFRILGRDTLQLRADHNSESFWKPKRAPTDIASYYRRF